MHYSGMSKSNFKYDDQGRAILGSAKEMAAWVKLGFEEQEKRKNLDIPYNQHFIDLRKCVLYVSYPIDSETPTSQIFNLCDLAGIVPGIEKLEDYPNFLFEVKLDIRFDGSILYGNFFHYVKFDGMVSMDEVTVRNTFSCFKCLFLGYVYMQSIHLTKGFTYEQCDFSKGLIMSGSKVGGINAQFNNCQIKERLSLSSVSFTNQLHSNPIELKNSLVANLNISKINTDGIPFYIQNTTIDGMKMDNLKMDGVLGFNTCILDGIITAVKDEDSPNNLIKELLLHSCNVKAQYHIENCDIGKVAFTFGKIEDSGRLRLSQCNVGELLIGSASIYGQMDVMENTISTVDLVESCVPGFLNFQSNNVQEYANRQTIRLLKNEALKVNDEVSAIHLYAKEMQSLLSDKSISSADKVSLRLNKLFSSYGENWIKAIGVTLFFSVVLTFLMLGFGSAKYAFDISGEFIGLGSFVTIMLDSINVFSIPLFSDTIKVYGLNVFGQILYILIKLVVAYGSYQFVVAFRKHGRS